MKYSFTSVLPTEVPSLGIHVLINNSGESFSLPIDILNPQQLPVRDHIYAICTFLSHLGLTQSFLGYHDIMRDKIKS